MLMRLIGRAQYEQVWDVTSAVAANGEECYTQRGGCAAGCADARNTCFLMPHKIGSKANCSSRSSCPLFRCELLGIEPYHVYPPGRVKLQLFKLNPQPQFSINQSIYLIHYFTLSESGFAIS